MYIEHYRPQFHFTARENWLNDPNGCVYHDGEYHLFFQHNPTGLEWGNMTWGHAVSPDLVHWRQLPHALNPYDGGTIFSGSAIVDSKNLSGLGDERQGPLIALFSHARKPFGQALAFSHDRGRTWKLYNEGRYVVPNQGIDEGERDPKVFWHEPSQMWAMVMMAERGRARFFNSPDLIHWAMTSDFVHPVFYECPDLFELPVDGDAQNTRWILHDAAFNYWVGAFDGKTFVPEAGPIQGDLGSNFYAAQTWNNTGRRVVQIAWMRGGQYPGMPFNQQMTFPCDLTLRTTPSGLRVYRMPVNEISGLHADTSALSGRRLEPGQTISVGPQGDLFDIEAEVEVPSEAGFSFTFYGQEAAWAGGKVSCLGKTAPLAAVQGRVNLRILLDRTSIELFGKGGEVSMSSCFLPDARDTRIQICAFQQPILIRSMTVHRLASAW